MARRRLHQKSARRSALLRRNQYVYVVDRRHASVNPATRLASVFADPVEVIAAVLVREEARLPVDATLQSKGSASIHEHSKNNSKLPPLTLRFRGWLAWGSWRNVVLQDLARADMRMRAVPLDALPNCF